VAAHPTPNPQGIRHLLHVRTSRRGRNRPRRAPLKRRHQPHQQPAASAPRYRVQRKPTQGRPRLGTSHTTVRFTEPTRRPTSLKGARWHPLASAPSAKTAARAPGHRVEPIAHTARDAAAASAVASWLDASANTEPESKRVTASARHKSTGQRHASLASDARPRSQVDGRTPSRSAEPAAPAVGATTSPKSNGSPSTNATTGHASSAWSPSTRRCTTSTTGRLRSTTLSASPGANQTTHRLTFDSPTAGATQCAAMRDDGPRPT
jgi:hypothetical protein